MKDFGDTRDPSPWHKREKTSRTIVACAVGVLGVMTLILAVADWNSENTSKREHIFSNVAVWSAFSFIMYKARTYRIPCTKIPYSSEEELTP